MFAVLNCTRITIMMTVEANVVVDEFSDCIANFGGVAQW